jgi:non-specific serine/threonine protein kinase
MGRVPWNTAVMRSRAASAVTLAVMLAGCTAQAPTPAPTPSAAGGSWRALAPAPTTRTEVVAAASGDRVYVVGGLRTGGDSLAAVEVFDTAAGTWAAGPDLPVAVDHAMATTVDGVVHVFGGYLDNGTPSDRAFRLDGDAWRDVAALPEGRAAGTAAAHGKAVYVAGGIGPDGLAREMLVYDAAADRWSTAPGPPTPREHLGGAGFGGLVYTVGGRVGGLGGNLDAFEAYDPGTRRWTTLPPLPTARGGLSAAATCNGLVVAVGGEEKATFAEAEAYDVRAGRWRTLAPLPTPRHGLGVVAIGATLYTFAGGPHPGLNVADVTEAIDLGACG